MFSNTDGSLALAPEKDFWKNFFGYEFIAPNVPNQSVDLEKIALMMEINSLRSEVAKLKTNFLNYYPVTQSNHDQSGSLEKITLISENKSLHEEVTKLQNLAYSLQKNNYVLNSSQQVDFGKAFGGGIPMQHKQALVHLITNAISWGATGVFATLFFSGTVIAPIAAGAGLVGGLITSIGLTVDSALR